MWRMQGADDEELSRAAPSDVPLLALRRLVAEKFGESSADCSFQGDIKHGGNMDSFRVHKAIMGQSPVFKAMLESGFMESETEKPIILEGYCSDILDLAFGFMYGYMWHDATLTQLTGLLEFGHQYELESLEKVALSEMENAVTSHVQNFGTAGEPCLSFMRAARRLSNESICSRMHFLFVQHYPWRTSGNSLRLNDMHEIDVRSIANMVITEDMRCRNEVEPASGSSLQNSSRPRPPRKCRYPVMKLSFLQAMIDWQGDVEASALVVSDITQNLALPGLTAEEIGWIVGLLSGSPLKAQHALHVLEQVRRDAEKGFRRKSRCQFHLRMYEKVSEETE